MTHYSGSKDPLKAARLRLLLDKAAASLQASHWLARPLARRLTGSTRFFDSPTDCPTPSPDPQAATYEISRHAVKGCPSACPACHTSRLHAEALAASMEAGPAPEGFEKVYQGPLPRCVVKGLSPGGVYVVRMMPVNR